MTDHFPGYDVLSKRDGMSWNDPTRRAIDQRLAVPGEARFFSASQWSTLIRLCDRIMPQPAERPAVPVAAYIDQKMLSFGRHGTRIAPMPYDGEAWTRGLEALEAEARAAHGLSFHVLTDDEADTLLRQAQSGELKDPAWQPMTSKAFFEHRILQDIPAAYYAHPAAWSEIGFGGPASPRGYVRLEASRRDPWEAAEAKPGHEAKALRDNQRVR